MTDELKTAITNFLMHYDNVVGKDLANLITKASNKNKEDFEHNLKVVKNTYKRMLTKAKEDFVNQMEDGDVVWKIDGVVYKGRANEMTDTYIDDYPENIKILTQK